MKSISEHIEELVREHALAVNNLTKAQLVESIRQAIACGDFERHVCPSNSSQAVIYIPHAREAYLTGRIRELEAQLRLAKIRCTVCGEYMPGHATGGTDICTCNS